MEIKGEAKTFADQTHVQKNMVSFVNEKTKNVSFNYICSVIPFIDITLDDESINPPYKINVTTIGFTIKFKTNYTGVVAWKATEVKS